MFGSATLQPNVWLHTQTYSDAGASQESPNTPEPLSGSFVHCGAL